MTGSSDGFVRAVKILPTKLYGVVVDHGEWGIERMAVRGKWLASVGHDQVLRLTDLEKEMERLGVRGEEAHNNFFDGI